MEKKSPGIRKFERLVGKADCTFGEGNFVNLIIRRKRKKLGKLCTNETSKQQVDERFLEHSNLFTFLQI